MLEGMTLWLEIGAAYLLLLAAGVALGRYLATRFDGRGGGGQHREPAPDRPDAPSFGAEWPPLGTAFDRALLPGAFDDDAVPMRSARG
jgi:hypothetical protein